MLRNRHKGKGRGTSSRSSTTTAALRTGLFERGIWLCNCSPRLPAEHFKVKKPGKNQGRWFYTCQKAAEERCDLFLWDEDAKPRMEAAVLANSLTEPVVSTTEAWRTASRVTTNANDATTTDPRKTPSPPPPYSLQTPETPKRGAKRKLPWVDVDADEDDTLLAPLTGSDEETLARAVELATPRKAAKHVEDSTTHGLHPAARSHGNLPTPETTPHKPSSASASAYPPTPSTPTPTRFVNPDAPSLQSEVLALLASHHVSLAAPTREALTALLTKHALRTQGIAKGREVARAAVHSREARIAALAGRVAALESEVESGKALVAFLRAGSGGGAGRGL